MARTSHIVLCDPDPQTASTVQGYLTQSGYRVTPAPTAVDLDRLVSKGQADLVILDFAVQGADALALARRLSEHTGLGILMLTSSGDCVERICGLEAGADDCVSKPIEPRELVARLKAILRRLAHLREPLPLPLAPASQVRLGNCLLDLDKRELTGPSGRPIAITEMEFSLLRTFVERPDQALNRDELAEFAYGRSWNPFDRSLDIRISRLRRKIEHDPARPEVITTVRGVGYRLETRTARSD